MLIPTPLALSAQTHPFDHPDWLYEIKHDGFRALAVVEEGRCRFFSRNKHRLTGFRDLAEAIVKELNVESAVLDGELAANDEHGRTVFAALMKRSHSIQYFSFDLLWLNGQDFHSYPLLWRKEKLKRLLPSSSRYMLYVDHINGSGIELYRLACQLDLEGIVAKKASSPYEENPTDPYWVKIKNPNYSQREGRADLFRRAG